MGDRETRVSHIFDTLGLHDRAAAIVYAFDRGIVRAETNLRHREHRGLTERLGRLTQLRPKGLGLVELFAKRVLDRT